MVRRSTANPTPGKRYSRSIDLAHHGLTRPRNVEEMCEGSEPITPDQINKVIKDEWDDVKKAVRSSPAARESFRKYLEKTVSEKVDTLIQQDKSELESLGVIERGL